MRVSCDTDVGQTQIVCLVLKTRKTCLEVDCIISRDSSSLLHIIIKGGYPQRFRMRLLRNILSMEYYEVRLCIFSEEYCRIGQVGIFFVTDLISFLYIQRFMQLWDTM